MQDTSALANVLSAADVILVGGAADVNVKALCEDVRTRTQSAAVLFFPFVFEGKRVSAATATIDALLHAKDCFVVVVDQEALVQASAATTTLNSVQLADDAACGAISTLLDLLTPGTTVSTNGVAAVSLFSALDKVLNGSGKRTVAAFGDAPLMLTPDADDASAAANISAALISAASTPFVAAVPAESRVSVVCVIRCHVQLPSSVVSAATSVLEALLPAGAPVILAQVVPGVTGKASVAMFVLQDANSVRWNKPIATATVAPSDVERVQSAAMPPQRHWAALSMLAGGTKQKASVAAPAPLPQPNPVPSAPVTDSEHLPDTIDDFDYADAEHLLDLEPAQRNKSVLPFLRWGPARQGERTVSQRASAVLASDRAASRTVVRLEYADGSTYEGEMRNGREEGTGRRVYANGHWYAGEWKDGQRHGWGVAQTASGRYEGLWENGRPCEPTE